MKLESRRKLVKNLVVAATLGLAAVASWSLTSQTAPSLEAAITIVQGG